MSRQNKGAFYGLLLLLGSLFGAITALFMSTDEKGEMRDSVKHKVARLKKFTKDVKEQERLEDIFGKVSDESKKIYREVRKNLTNELASLKESLEEVDKKKYTQVVNSVMSNLKEEGKTTAKQLSKIKDYLMEDYKAMKNQTKETS